MKTYRIYIFRHGLTKDNETGIYSGKNESTLSEKGRKELEVLRDNYEYPKIDIIFSSPLKRAAESSKILFPNLEPVVMDGLSEYDFGEFEGKTAAELHETEPLFDRWLKGDPKIAPPFGESEKQFARRVCSTFSRIVEGIIKTGTDNVGIITHAGVISTILSNFALPEAKPTDWVTEPGNGYELRVTPYLWMSGKKVEAVSLLPYFEEEEKPYYDGWDYYPNDDDFDISEYLKDFKKK